MRRYCSSFQLKLLFQSYKENDCFATKIVEGAGGVIGDNKTNNWKCNLIGQFKHKEKYLFTIYYNYPIKTMKWKTYGWKYNQGDRREDQSSESLQFGFKITFDNNVRWFSL